MFPSRSLTELLAMLRNVLVLLVPRLLASFTALELSSFNSSVTSGPFEPSTIPPVRLTFTLGIPSLEFSRVMP